MKTTLFLLSMVMAATCAFSQNTEDESIKKVIRAETTSFYNRDMDAWQRTWLYSSKISWTYVANGSYNTISGWDNLSSFANDIMKNNPEKSLVDIKNDSFNITRTGNIAWVEYKQRITTVGTDSNIISQSHAYRALVKDKNEWKLLSMIAHDQESFTSNTPESIENSLNTTGYNLMAANRLNDAIEVFRLNVKLNPKGWNTYDSLGEALALAENKKEAIENYEKSVKLNPKNQNGIKALQKLRSK